MSTLLQIDDLHVSYGAIRALRGISFKVDRGAIVTLIGANGAGKSTLLRTISGLLKPKQGRILYWPEGNGESKEPCRLSDLAPHEIVRRGIAQVPEGRIVFANLSVKENLQMGAFTRLDKAGIAQDWEYVMTLFPRLAERLRQNAGTLSGGEQQMLAIGRALMGRPKLLLLDEPSLGLAPLIVKQIFEAIRKLNTEFGVSVFLVEQSAYHALKLAHRGYVMVNGRITMSGTGSELLGSPEVQAAYLEGGAAKEGAAR
jgi:branched-chain amino acid transport system ATP-binding protein